MPPDEALEDVRYANSYRLLDETLGAFLPPERVTVAEHAAKHRWLTNEGGGYVGRWLHDEVPYCVEPMESLSDRLKRHTAIVGPGQCAKTSIAENWLLKSVDVDPAPFLWFMQTEDGLEAYVKSRINPMITAQEEMKRKLGPLPVDNSLHFKRFEGMTVEFLSATHGNLISKRAPRGVYDEVDAYDQSLGNIKELADVRMQTYGEHAHGLFISHPDLAAGLDPETDWTRGIMAIYADSDRRVWYWRCPECDGYSTPCPMKGARHMALVYPDKASLDEIEATASLLCPLCGSLIEDRHRKAMNLTGRWVGLGQEIDEKGHITGQLVQRQVAGFWIVGPMSPFVFGGIGALARARAKAERELALTGDDKTLRTVVVKQWGFPYGKKAQVEQTTAEVLIERAKGEASPLGTVPDFVRVLTAAIDVQANRFEVLVRGFGPGGESAIVDVYQRRAEPATSPEDWDELLKALFAKRYPLTGDRSRGMAIRGLLWDSGGEAGVTAQAYDAFRRHRRTRAIRLYGTIAGRNAWSALPAKGASGLNAPRLNVTYPDRGSANGSRNERKTARSGDVPLARFNPNDFKDDLAGQLQVALPGPGYIHIPAGLLVIDDLTQEPAKEQPFFAQLVAEQRDKRGAWAKGHQGVRNEALDLMVMADVAAHLHGLKRIDWERPPGWAAPWESNIMIGPMAETRIGELARFAKAVAAAVAPLPTEPAAAEEGGAMSRAKKLLGF